MEILLWLRVAVAAVADLSLSAMCGLLLAAFWLRGSAKLVPLRGCAAILCAASWGQLLMLGETFSDSGSLRAILAMMPDVVGMHAGRVLLDIGVLSAGLVLWVWLIRGGSVQLAGAAVLLVGMLTLRAATGHAAVEGDFSRAEVLEGVHLVAMALWSGGVLVSGLLIAPRLVGGGRLRSYVEALSRVSTWAVGVVVSLCALGGGGGGGGGVGGGAFGGLVGGGGGGGGVRGFGRGMWRWVVICTFGGRVFGVGCWSRRWCAWRGCWGWGRGTGGC